MVDQKPNSDVLLVIATYNERENLPDLVHELVDQLPDLKILVIDDGSPDGTGSWCDSAQELYPQLSVIHRHEKLGLGSATRLGFAYALEHNVEFVATMDADFSHEPASLSGLIQALTQSSDPQVGVVIGSRYIAGGRIIGWPLHRKIASRAVNAYARFCLGLSTHDNSGAFRVYRVNALRKLEMAKINSEGYGYLEEILWRLKRAGVRMIELPITYRDRECGQSKANLKVGLSVILEITKLGLGRWK